MTTLVVTTSHDYSSDSLTGITEIDFDNTTNNVSVTFAASQFDNTHISTSVHIVINNGANNFPFNDIYITMASPTTFSAASWTATNWFAGFVDLGGSSGVDHITGSPVFNYFHVTAGDVLTGGGDGNTFDIATASDIAAGGQITGGAGTDRLDISGSGTYDFTQITMSSIEGVFSSVPIRLHSSPAPNLPTSTRFRLHPTQTSISPARASICRASRSGSRLRP